MDERGQPRVWTPVLTATQKYLWHCYAEEDVPRVVELARGDPVILAHLGDPTQGNAWKQELVSSRDADQILMAAANMAPWFALHEAGELDLTAVRFVVGTSAHEFYEGSAPILVAEILRKAHPDVNISIIRHGLATVQGVVIDYAHHGAGPGIRHWTRGNVLRYYVWSIVNDAVMRGEAPPRVILRAHYHEYVPETLHYQYEGDWRVCDGLIVPAYCALGEHARQSTRSKGTISNGLVALEIEDGELAGIYAFQRTVDLRTKEAF